jgi:effector-binding domain-containing protein
MKSLFVLLLVIMLCISGAQAQDHVRPTIVGDMIIRAVPPLTAATVSVKALDYTPKHGWEPGNRGVRHALETMLRNGYDKLARWMKEGGHPVGPSFVIFNQDPAKARPQSLSCKLGYPVSADANGRRIATIEVLPSTVSAVVRFKGTREDQVAVLDTLGRWIAAHGYSPAGPVMEIYLEGIGSDRTDADDLAEIRWPVRRTAPNADLSLDPQK